VTLQAKPEPGLLQRRLFAQRAEHGAEVALGSEGGRVPEEAGEEEQREEVARHAKSRGTMGWGE
jgi:hypothetical protein